MKKIFSLFSFLFFLILPVNAQDLNNNSEVTIVLQHDYSGTEVFSAEGGTFWNSEQFEYLDHTVGVFAEAGYFFFGNETRVNVGEFKWATAGTSPLPTPVNPVFYTLQLRTKSPGDYTITHEFKLNEGGPTVTKVQNGRIVSGTNTDENPFFTSTVSVYPNPTKDMANVTFNTPYGGHVDVITTDAIGRVVHSIGLNATPGQNTVRVKPGRGTNFIRVVGANQVLTTKVIAL